MSVEIIMSSGSLKVKRALPPDRALLERDDLFSERQRKYYEAFCEAGTMNGAARLLEAGNDTDSVITASNVSSSVRITQAKALNSGWVPNSGSIVADPETVKKNEAKVARKLKNKVSTFVVTWAQNATPAHAEFLASLKEYCKHRGATLLVIAGRYKNPTSQWTQSSKDSEYWVSEVEDYLIDTRIELNKNCIIMGDIKTQPTAETPLSGFKSITQDKTGIFGHPKVALESVATPQNMLPKLLCTTGAVTVENYTDSKAGVKGEFHHTLGATVVEIQDDHFFMRQINACEDGTFIDLLHEYTPDGVKKAGRAKGLVLGDLHTEFIDPKCEEAIFGKKGLVDVFDPEKVVMHDWYDGYSGSHHHKNKLFINFVKHHSGMGDVAMEVNRTLNKTAEWVKPGRDYFIVDSNHNQHLVQWLEEVNPKTDFVNTLFWCEIMSMMLPEAFFDKTRAVFPNPLQLLAEERLGLPNLHFTTSTDELFIGDIDCSQHGHKGPNGSRGSVNAFATLGVKSITGHGHSPGIKHGHYRVGHNSYPDLEYVDGPSSWLQSDCLIYANGKRTLIHKLDGKWRANRGR